jgi:integrase/recombinase XerD
LLFLARTGARISEALGIDASGISLDGTRSQVILRGKGRKQRVVPLAQDVAKSIHSLLQERCVNRHDQAPIFVGLRGQRMTRFGATHVPRRAITTASRGMPELKRKHISLHVFRHYVSCLTRSTRTSEALEDEPETGYLRDIVLALAAPDYVPAALTVRYVIELTE